MVGPRPASRGQLAFRARRTQRVRWFLWRGRRLIAAGAVGFAVMVVVAELRPAPAPTQPVLLARHAISAGSAVGERDVRVVSVPLELVPQDALTDPAQAAGRSAAITLSRDGILTAHSLAGSDVARTAPDGTVIVPVRLSDPEIIAFLTPGDRVDLILVPDADMWAASPPSVTAPTVTSDGNGDHVGGGASEGEPNGRDHTVVLASRALVLPVARRSEAPRGGLLGSVNTDQDVAVLLVAVTADEARSLTASARSGYIGAVIVS